MKKINTLLALLLSCALLATGCSSGEKAADYSNKAEISSSDVKSDRAVSSTQNSVRTDSAVSAEKPANTGEFYSEGAYYETAACYDECEGVAYDTSLNAFNPEFNTEEYNSLTESGFSKVSVSPQSTFAADVDTASFCNLRRMIRDGYSLSSIPSGAVRTEEMLNYFDYDVTNISDGKFSVQYETNTCPWNPEHDLLLMTVMANELKGDYKGSNFVFLIDTSGSMSSYNKIFLAESSFKLLAQSLGQNDRVSIVTYSGNSRLVLDGANGSEYDRICSALDNLSTGGGTNGSGGIEAAYRCAMDNFIEGGNNRVIIASDGDMNLGITSSSGLTDLIKEKKESGVFLTVLGFGSGNYSDTNMEAIADAGNGNYYYIDCIEEAENVLVNKLMQTTVTVAKDVKFQAEFNPNHVSEYRLIGYENRMMAAEDFADDTKDGGEVGAGQQVTVCYELVYNNGNEEGSMDSGLKYQSTPELTEKAMSDEILTLSIRYKQPDGDTSILEEYTVVPTANEEMSPDFCLASGIIEASMLIRGSAYTGNSTWQSVEELVKKGMNNDKLRSMLGDWFRN